MRTHLAGIALATLIAIAPAAALPQAMSRIPLPDDERSALHAEIRAYLLANPEILIEMLALLEERQKVETEANDRELIAANTEAIFEDGFSFVGGNPEGSVTIVEFLDYQCGFCRTAHPEVAELITTDGDIRWIVKELPILGPNSVTAARAAIATHIEAGAEAYAAVHDALMRLEGPLTDARLDAVLTEAGLEPAAIRAAMDGPEVERRIAETRTLAQTLAVSGTPTFIFDTRMVRGYLPLAQMQELVGDIRATN